MFNWLRAKKSMAEEIKNLRSRLDIERKEQSLLRRKLDSARSEVALLKRNKQVTTKKDDKVLDTIAQSGEDISRYVPTVDHERKPAVGSPEWNSYGGGFPYGALVSKD